MKRKNPRFHSPEGVPCQQIGSYHYAHPISLPLSFRNHYRSMNIRITPLLPNPHQSVFCESLENALGIHPIVFLCEQALCRALRLTFCQLERLPSGDDVLHLIHCCPLIPHFDSIEIPHDCAVSIVSIRRQCRGDRSGRPVQCTSNVTPQCTSNKHPSYIITPLIPHVDSIEIPQLKNPQLYHS